MEYTIEGILRTRVVALLTKHGVSATGIAKAMGRSHTWLLRKLDPTRADCRPFTLSDLADVLKHLGEPPDALLAPVLLAGDVELLAYCAGGSRATDDVAAVFRDHIRSTASLIGQGLLTQTNNQIKITAAGAELLN